MTTKIGRNDPCICGSGRKYKRCCLERDEAAQREQPSSGSESSRLALQTDQESIWEALEESVAAVTTKDRRSLSRHLEAFADLLRENAVLADLRFADAPFGDAIEQSLRALGRDRGDADRRGLFRLAMQKLGDRRTLQVLGDRLARAMTSPTLSPSNREAVAAALVCMAPVLERVPLPPSESPTIEIIFNVQLDDCLARRQSEVGGADERLRQR